jgi:ADP-heptose:LPS heptosyltransferase
LLARLNKYVRESSVWLAVFAVFPGLFAVQILVARILNWAWLRMPAPEAFDLSPVKRVLVVRLDAVGDGILNTPFLRELRKALPQARITAVVSPQLYPLLAVCPYVDELLPFDCSVPFRWRAFLLPWRALRMARSEFWRRHFDLAILPRREFDFSYGAFLIFFSRAPWRIGYTEHVNSRKHRLNPGADYLFTNVITPRHDCQHEVNCNLDVLRALGGEPEDDRTELWTSAEDEAFCDAVLGPENSADALPLIGLAPGSSSWLRRWPAEKFRALVQALLEVEECRFAVVGNKDEQELGALIAVDATSVLNLVGKTTLRQCAAILRRCTVVVANDSGPMHMAAAMRTNVVALYGSTCEHRFGPWKNHTIVTLDYPCRPCHQGHVIDSCRTCIFDRPRCLTELPVDRVVAAVREQLSRVISSNSLVRRLPALVKQRSLSDTSGVAGSARH